MNSAVIVMVLIS